MTGVLLGLGYRVTAIEPDEGMLSLLTRKFPQATAFVGTAERLPLPDASVDAVVVAQAFHWVDKTVAFVEIARVLRPGVGAVLSGMIVIPTNGRRRSVVRGVNGPRPWARRLNTLFRSTRGLARLNGTTQVTHKSWTRTGWSP